MSNLYIVDLGKFHDSDNPIDKNFLQDLVAFRNNVKKKGDDVAIIAENGVHANALKKEIHHQDESFYIYNPEDKKNIHNIDPISQIEKTVQDVRSKIKDKDVIVLTDKETKEKIIKDPFEKAQEDSVENPDVENGITEKKKKRKKKKKKKKQYTVSGLENIHKVSDFVRDYNSTETFRSFDSFFPQPSTSQDFWLTLIGALAAGVTVIPGAIFGGSFGVNLFKKIAALNGYKYSQDEEESVRGICAAASAVVNGYINGLSIKLALEKINAELGAVKNKITEKQLKIAIALLGILALNGGLAGVATVANIQMVLDTVKSVFGKVSISALTAIVGEAMNFRAVVGAIDFGREKTSFGDENREAARQIRLNILNELNAALPESERITEDDINLLSKGKIVKDKFSPYVRTIFDGAGILAPLPYSVGYFVATKDAMSKLFDEEGDHSVPTQAIIELGVYGFSIIGFLLKYAFLGKASFNVVDKFVDKILADPIIQLEAEKNKSWKRWAFDWTLSGLNEAFHIGVALASLTGADGLTQKYLDHELLEKFFKLPPGLFDFELPILISTVGAAGINYQDFRNINGKVATSIVDGIRKWRQTIHDYNAKKYGKDKNEFIKKTMINIAMTGDSAILNRFTNKYDSKSESANNKQIFYVNGQYAFTAKESYEKIIQSAKNLQPLTNADYDKFLSTILDRMKTDDLVDLKEVKKEKEEKTPKIAYSKPHVSEKTPLLQSQEELKEITGGNAWRQWFWSKLKWCGDTDPDYLSANDLSRPESSKV